jgi:hypothetical protein
MTEQEIISYFGVENTIYTFNGTLQQLADLQNANGNSYSYLVAGNVIYFKADLPVNNPNAPVFHQGAV